jgi:pimeloyl-ACP methyl ester carboxylesterase
MGGFVSAELAINFPERVEHLVLVSPAGISTRGYRAYLPTLHGFGRVLASGTARVAANADTIARRPRLRGVALSTLTRHPIRLPAPLTAETLRGAGKVGFVEALEALSAYSIRDRLPEIACPTLIVWGEDDRIVPVRDADVFAEMIPGSRKVVVEDTGHLAMLERPAAFNELLEDFLSE